MRGRTATLMLDRLTMAETNPQWVRVKLALAAALLLTAIFIVAARVAARSHIEDHAVVLLMVVG